ncbi:unnamed protein product [Urochloa humidicola]
MPFSNLAEYVPEHGLWFGISSRADGRRFTAANLMLTESGETTVGPPPVVHGSWKELIQLPPEWSLVRSQAVYLGSSKFCIVRFFEVGELRVCPKTRRTLVEDVVQTVITGVEVESCGGSGGEELRMVRHKSERYKLDILSEYWIL